MIFRNRKFAIFARRVTFVRRKCIDDLCSLLTVKILVPRKAYSPSWNLWKIIIWQTINSFPKNLGIFVDQYLIIGSSEILQKIILSKSHFKINFWAVLGFYFSFLFFFFSRRYTHRGILNSNVDIAVWNALYLGWKVLYEQHKGPRSDSALHEEEAIR